MSKHIPITTSRNVHITHYTLHITILFSLLLTGILFLIPVTYSGPRNIGPIENIDGIPFSYQTPTQSPPYLRQPAEGKEEGVIQVTEKLAHADIYFKEPVLAKELTLTVTFDPKNLESLAVGIRQDPFWLSYGDRAELYRRAGETPGVSGETPGVKEARITVPLTDKLQDTDRSIDLMFFALSAEASREGRADTGTGFAEADEGLNDTTNWELHGLTAHVRPTLPTKAQLKDYIRSIVKRERPL